MRFGWRAVLLFLAASGLGFGQKNEYIQLNRELLTVEEQMRAFQKSMEEKIAQILQQAQQATEAANKGNSSVAELDKRVQEQAKTMVEPVASMGLKVDQMASEFQALKESVAALNVRFGKLEQQIVDIGTALKTLQSPVAPPAPAGGPAAGLSADVLFQNAVRDKDGGNLELALRGFQTYVQNYGTTYLASTAQYYIGEIYYQNGKYEEAAQAFDAVAANYPQSDKAPDAQYMRGMAFTRMGARAEAASEFRALIKNYPNSPLVAKARAQLKPPATPVKSSKTKK
jgi:tol-pal system protein YbgF